MLFAQLFISASQMIFCIDPLFQLRLKNYDLVLRLSKVIFQTRSVRLTVLKRVFGTLQVVFELVILKLRLL